MGDSKLCLLLLLSTSALTLAQDDGPACLLAQRFAPLHTYEYQYTAESLNFINGASTLKNGPKGSCKVEIEVPQTCSFIVRTTGCSLSEVARMDADGNPEFQQAASSDDFAAEMERYPLKVTVEGESELKLYPDEGEKTTILNVKRGIISALAVPWLKEGRMNQKMPTIHGKCRTSYTINAQADAETDITLNRDLSKCEKFIPVKDHTSPLALVSGMHYPLAQLVRSSQACNYKFDNEKKHMTSGSCVETHMLIPFSYKGEYGVTNVGKQELTLIQISPSNDRVFELGVMPKSLYMDTIEDKSVVQDKDAALQLLRDLAELPESDNDKRANIFRKLVNMVRGMKAETLSPAIPEAVAVSRVLTYQVLAQCGTPECSSGIMQILRTLDSSAVEVDTAVFALGVMSNPSPLLINDLLQMAKFKTSKPIMYALSNVVKRFYKVEEQLIPEIFSVAEFMAAELGDCSGDQDKTFMTLRVIGNMAPAMAAAGPAVRSAVMQCVNQPEASQAVQQAAIQVFRLALVPEEGREALMQVLLDNTSPVPKRIAAYLVLVKNPKATELVQLADEMTKDHNIQVKNFVASHLTNVLSSTERETAELRQMILDALQGNELMATLSPIKFSRNYKIGSVEGNMIFEGTSYLPKEVMLEMTLKAFGYDLEMVEFGMEGKGFEPTVESLFGEQGFFPDTALKTIFFVSDNMPLRVSEIMQNFIPSLKKDRMKRQTTQNLMREIGQNLNKLITDLKASQSPEAMVYLRLFGNELGYLRTNEIEEMAYSAVMMIDSMMKLFPSDLMKALMTKADNSIYAHYIFMDNEFFLPTLTGVPLRIALSGTFTPGIKGGLQVSSDMTEIAFMPTAGLEFLTQIGSFIPEYINSGLEMHTSIFHESGLRAKISFERGSVKVSIPAPKSPTKFITLSNSLVAVTGSETITIPSMVMDKVDVGECTLAFAGMKYCTALQYMDAFNQDTAPYFPFTGDSKFTVELHPTGEVTEYTGTLNYELLKEGEEGRQKVDSLKFILRAEGAQPTEATAIVKYNRRTYTVTLDLQIPDFDLEAGLRLGLVDGNSKGKGTHSISLDFINKNIPQLSLVGRANVNAMKEAMLQFQLTVPLLNTDATITANVKRDQELELELKSDIKVMDATSKQMVAMKYDASRIEFEFKSDMDAMTKMLPNLDVYANQLLDKQVGETDMKVRHIFLKLVEAVNNYMDKYGADVPYIQNFRVPDMPEISLPETLSFNTDAKVVYYFSNERVVLALPLPLGGKSTEELNFPPVLTTPHVSLPKFGLEIVSMEIPIPELIVPERLALSIPLFSKAEIKALMRSNLYDADASLTAEKKDPTLPSYSTKLDVKGTSSFDVLSFKMEGSGMLDVVDSIKAQLQTSFAHKFLEARIDIMEDASITDKINLKSNSKIEATSPLGLNFALEHKGLAGIKLEEISGESNLDVMFKAGPMYGKTLSTQSFTISPFKPEAMLDSTVQLDSTFIRAQNKIAASLANWEVSVVSNTNAFENILTHLGELSVKDSKLSMKSDANVLALGMTIRNQAEALAGAGEIALRMETNGDHTENRVYSLLTASFDVNGLTLNSDATLKLLENEAAHKASLKMNKDGLVVSGTNTLRSPLTLENTFSAELDSSKALVSSTNKVSILDIKFDTANSLTMTLASVDFSSKADAILSTYASYNHDIIMNVKPYTASANVKNDLKLLGANFINEAQLAAELFKLDFTGSMKAMYGEEEIKHVYQVNYAEMAATAKCSTTGKLLGTHMNQNTELEIIGLAARFSNDARFNSQLMRFDNTIRCSIVPFDVNIDAIFNADGDLTMYGKHSAQLYGKFLLKAQPLAFASTQQWRAAVTQKLDNGFSLETTFDNNMETVLTPQEQKTSFRLKSKMNDHTFNQGLSLYNTPERTGVEVFGTILTNFINIESTENQEFTLSGFLKYDKNADSHAIQIPFFESVPAFLESVKVVVVRVAEAVRNFINNEEVQAKLEALPQRINEFVSQMDIEGKVTQLKQYFIDFTQTYAISLDDVDATLRNLKVTVEKLLADLTVYVQNFVSMMKEIVANAAFPDSIIQYFQEQINAFNAEYDIRGMIMYMIDTLKEMMQRIDLNKLKDSSIAFLIDIDAKYDVRAYLESFMTELKAVVETFDMTSFVTEMQKFIMSINFRAPIEELLKQIPTEKFNDMIEYIRKLIQDLDIVGMINTFYSKMRELIVKFEVDKMAQTILEQAVELIKQFKIEETIQTAFNMVRNANIPSKLMQVFQDTIEYLKSTEVKDIITQLNVYIETLVQKLNSLNYNDFVEYANGMITEYTASLNELISSLEIPEKLAKTTDLVNVVLSNARNFMEHLREIKIAEVIKSLKDVLDDVVLKNIQKFAEFVKLRINDLDVNATLSYYLDIVKDYYTNVTTIITKMLNTMVEIMKGFVPDQKIISEMQQIVFGLITELKKFEFMTPSFTLPLTDLIVPSLKFSMVDEFEIPAELNIPEFTILGSYKVEAMTVSLEDIKQRIISIIDMIVNFEIKMPDVDAFFAELTMNYLPSMPELTLPEITLPEIAFPRLPQVPVEKFVKSLEIPEIKLPTIPTEIMVPCFGKLYGEIKFITPIYTTKTSAEFQNSTEDNESPQFSGAFASEATSPRFELLSYKFDSAVNVAFPKRSRIVIVETMKHIHLFITIDHQASLTLYGISGQAQAKTTAKVTTSPYNAELMNTFFVGMEGGMSASLETTYIHDLKLPMLTSEISMTQKAVLRQQDLTLILTAENVGTGKLNSENCNHKSNMELKLTPGVTTLTFSGDSDSPIMKMKQQVTAELGTFSYIKFNMRNEAVSPFIKNSVIEASALGNLYDMKFEMKVNHDTELNGEVSNGVLSNCINIALRPVEFFFEFQNKGNAKIQMFDSLMAKVDLQNDYSALFKPDSQQINTVALARLNQYKMSYNVTLNNNKKDAGVFVAVDGEANLDFLTSPISIPAIELPFVDFRTPAVSDLNLYEQTFLKNILTTTEQSINMDAKLVYQKAIPLFDVVGLFQIPSLGNLITDLSVKSSIINLNANAGLYNEDDLVFRLGAATLSEFEILKAKLDATTSLTTKRGIKLATAMSLESSPIVATHDSSITLNSETFAPSVSVATVAKISLPICHVEANQNLVADIATVASNLKVKGDFDVPVIKAVGKFDADHSLKMEGAFEYISLESTTRANMEGNVLENYLLVGLLDNEVNVYLNKDGLRSTSKIISDAKLNSGTNKVIAMDVNENLAIEASLSRIYAVFKCAGNNEANLFNFNTNGKQNLQATIDFAPMSSLVADIEIDITQPNTLGELTIFGKTVAEVTPAKQKISANAKFVTPLYKTNLAADVEGNAPVFKVAIKSSANSVLLFLEYDLDASTTLNFEDDTLKMISKAVLNHSDLVMDVNHAIAQVLRMKRQADSSASYQTLNVDITSPVFTDANIRFAARRDGISASVSTPPIGFLGLQLNGRVPSQMTARLFGRYATSPDVDIDFLVITSSPKDADKMTVQIAYNIEAPKLMLSELKIRLPSIIDAFAKFAEKYQLTSTLEQMKNTFYNRISEVYNAAVNYDESMSQLSVFFRTTIVEYQKTIQLFLDAAVNVLRETRFKMPGSDEMTTLPEVLQRLTKTIADMLDATINFIYENGEVYYNTFVETINNVKLQMPVGDAITVGQIMEQVKATFRSVFAELVDFVKKMERLDTMIEKINETVKAIVDKSQEFIDSVKSDYLESVLVNFNVVYRNLVILVKNVVDQVYQIVFVNNMEILNDAFDYMIYLADQLNTTLNGLLQKTTEEVQAYVRVKDGRLELEVPFTYQL